MTSLFSCPEEKLWIVVKDYQSSYKFINNDLSSANSNHEQNNSKRGFKLERNSIIKLGRVRLRVKDIDNDPQGSILNQN